MATLLNKGQAPWNTRTQPSPGATRKLHLSSATLWFRLWLFLCPATGLDISRLLPVRAYYLKWWFPQMGVPQIIQINGIFHEIDPQTIYLIPPFMENYSNMWISSTLMSQAGAHRLLNIGRCSSARLYSLALHFWLFALAGFFLTMNI